MRKTPFRVHGVSNSLWNEDIAAVPRDERTWGAARFCSLWLAMSVCVPAYLLASGLIAVGMSGKQALGTILLGDLIVLTAVTLNAHAGAKYGIPFAVYVRASFGVLGANVPAVLQALAVCGWFGIQCWIGGQALVAMLRVLAPGGVGPNTAWYCFAAFWLLNMLVVLRGVETVKALQMVSVPLLLAIGLALLFWMVGRAGGFGAVLASAGELRGGAGGEKPDFWRLFPPSLTGVVGFWATMAMTISDDSRYAKTQKAQIVGQAIGLPIATTLYSFLAIGVTAATVVATRDHRAIWNPTDLIASFHRPVIVLVGLGALAWATLNTNVAANVVGPSHSFSNLKQSLISFRMGGLITGVLGVLCMPWRLTANPERYLHGWLVGCSGLLGPIAGVMIADYFVVRRRALDPESLYVRGGEYEYNGGFNLRALAALGAGVMMAFVGLFVAPLHSLYDYAWFVGFGVAAAVYLILMSGPAERAEIPPTPLLIPLVGFEGEGA